MGAAFATLMFCCTRCADTHVRSRRRYAPCKTMIMSGVRLSLCCLAIVFGSAVLGLGILRMRNILCFQLPSCCLIVFTRRPVSGIDIICPQRPPVDGEIEDFGSTIVPCAIDPHLDHTHLIEVNLSTDEFLSRSLIGTSEEYAEWVNLVYLT